VFSEAAETPLPEASGVGEEPSLQDTKRTTRSAGHNEECRYQGQHEQCNYLCASPMESSANFRQ
jgi:hypothetical protein